MTVGGTAEREMRRTAWTISRAAKVCTHTTTEPWAFQKDAAETPNENRGEKNEQKEEKR